MADARARDLRQNATDAERILWAELRGFRRAGMHFRRQAPFGRYIVDFACHEARLIIEIDGGQHDPTAPQEVERKRFLEDQGYRLLRFWKDRERR